MTNSSFNLRTSTLIFIGRSGSGKGTQARLLKSFLAANRLPFVVMETGERFRSFITGETVSARRAEEVMAAGIRQPDFLAIWLWAQELVNKVAGEECFIFDGSPRSVLEAQALDTALDFYRKSHLGIIYLDIPEEVAKERLLARGRADDTPTAIEKRLAWFESDVAPVVEWYQNHSRASFWHIDGTKSIETINQEIITLLGYGETKD